MNNIFTIIFLKICIFTLYFSFGVFLYLKIINNSKYTPPVIQIWIQKLSLFELIIIIFTIINILQLMDFIILDYFNIQKYDLNSFSNNMLPSSINKDSTPVESFSQTTTTTTIYNSSTNPQPITPAQPAQPSAQGNNDLLNGGIMATAVGAGVKYAATTPGVGGKLAVIGSALALGGAGIVVANVTGNVSTDLGKKKNSFLADSSINDSLADLFNLTGNNAIDLLNMIQFFLNLQIFLIVFIIYNFLLLSINESKIENLLLKFLSLKTVNMIIKYLIFSRKTIKILIICSFVLLLISSIYSSYYLNFYILNLDSIIDLYLKK